MAAQAEQAEGENGTPPAQLPEIQDACNFCAAELPLPEELIQGVLHRASKLSLGGASKSYKTWALLNLALCVAYEVPWLGCSTIQAKVLVVNLEIQSAFARERLRVLTRPERPGAGCRQDSESGWRAWNQVQVKTGRRERLGGPWRRSREPTGPGSHRWRTGGKAHSLLSQCQRSQMPPGCSNRTSCIHIITGIQLRVN